MSKLDERLKQAQANFDAVKSEMEKIAEQRRGLDQRTNELQAELLRLQGEYRALVALKEPETPAPAGDTPETVN